MKQMVIFGKLAFEIMMHEMLTWMQLVELFLFLSYLFINYFKDSQYDMTLKEILYLYNLG